MTARPCPECGGLVASTLQRCPHCGYQLESTPTESKRAFESNPYNSLGWIIAAIILFWPLGIISIYYYIKSDDMWQTGNREMALQHGANSQRFAKYALYAACIAFFVGVFCPFAIFGFFA